MVDISPSQYDSIDPDDSDIWRITTTGDSVYLAGQIEVTDSDIVIRNLVSDTYEYTQGSGAIRLEQSDIPYSVNRNDVVRLEREITEYWQPILVIGIPAAVLISGLIIYASGPRGSN